MKLKFKIGLGEIEILIRAGWTQRLTGWREFSKIWQSPLWETPLCGFRFKCDIVDTFFHASRAAWPTCANKLPRHLQEGTTRAGSERESISDLGQMSLKLNGLTVWSGLGWHTQGPLV